MPTTPIYALRYPAQTDPADVPTDLQELATDVEAAFGGSRYRGALTPAAFAALTGVADGDVADLIVDATAGVVWRLRYRAASPAAYKWELIGGPPLSAYVDTSQATASLTYVDLGTVLSLTAPRAGEYLIEHGFNAYTNAVTAENLWASVKLGAAAVADAEGQYTWHNAANMAQTTGRTMVRALGTGDVVKQMYKVVAGTTGNFRTRFLKLTPVRVS